MKTEIKTTLLIAANIVITEGGIDYPLMVYMDDSSEIGITWGIIILNHKREACIRKKAVKVFKKMYNIK